MPSYLGEYEGAASDRETKFLRAVRSFVNQTYQDKELIIVSDGCEITRELLTNNMSEWGSCVDLVCIDKQPLFSGNVRATGVEIASGEIICYLDTDDFLGLNHLQVIANNMRVHDWVYFDEYLNQGTVKPPAVKSVELLKDSAGTSSIAHLKENAPSWHGCDGYGHDWIFIDRLMNWSKNYKKMYGASYQICHIPRLLDF